LNGLARATERRNLRHEGLDEVRVGPVEKQGVGEHQVVLEEALKFGFDGEGVVVSDASSVVPKLTKEKSRMKMTG
jgi:hypothetical protein